MIKHFFICLFFLSAITKVSSQEKNLEITIRKANNFSSKSFQTNNSVKVNLTLDGDVAIKTEILEIFSADKVVVDKDNKRITVFGNYDFLLKEKWFTSKEVISQNIWNIS